MQFPAFDPFVFHITPTFGLRWYAVAYIAGLTSAWWGLRRLAVKSGGPVTPPMIDDFLFWATLGVVGGGRLGYVLFYQPGYYLSNPAEIVQVWHGGMSFHGGLTGVIAATWFYARSQKIPPLALGDLIVTLVPLGLFFGRLANFVNGELWGRPSEVAWAMIFPNDPEQLPRHPSQLYEAGLEGVVLFALMITLWFQPSIRARRGSLTGIFLMGYGIARFVGELFRQPDPFLGYLWQGATMGQLLSLPMIVAGAAVLVWASRRSLALPS